MSWAKIGVIAVVVVAAITFYQFYQSQADILYSIDPPNEIMTTSGCSIYVKNVGKSTGSFTLTVTSNNFFLSGGNPEPRHRSDSELRFAEFSYMSGEGHHFTFTMGVTENLSETASYTIRLDRHTWPRGPLEETFFYAF